MTILVTGGSKCGKSRFAEQLLHDFKGRKFYVATMQPYGSDAQEAIARHREMRRTKGFETLEQYTDLAALSIPDASAVLVECIGNLCANEMFSALPPTDPTEKICTAIRTLSKQSECLVIVTNEVGSDGIPYDSYTQDYIRILHTVNRELTAIADTVYECVFGIPILLKGTVS